MSTNLLRHTITGQILSQLPHSNSFITTSRKDFAPIRWEARCQCRGLVFMVCFCFGICLNKTTLFCHFPDSNSRVPVCWCQNILCRTPNQRRNTCAFVKTRGDRESKRMAGSDNNGDDDGNDNFSLGMMDSEWTNSAWNIHRYRSYHHHQPVLHCNHSGRWSWLGRWRWVIQRLTWWYVITTHKTNEFFHAACNETTV